MPTFALVNEYGFSFLKKIFMIKRKYIDFLMFAMIFATLALLCPQRSAAATDGNHSPKEGIRMEDSVFIYFPLNGTDILPYLRQHTSEMEEFLESLKESYDSGRLKKVEIRAYSCLIGYDGICRNIAMKRAENLADYITAHSGIPSEAIEIAQTGIGWEALLEMVRKDGKVPGHDEAIEAITETPVWIFDDQGKIIGGKKKQIMEIERGRSFAYMREHFFEKMRYASAQLYIQASDTTAVNEPEQSERPEQEALPAQTAPQTAAPDTVDADPVPAVAETGTGCMTLPQQEDLWETSKVWLKTNIPYWGLVVPNLAVEVRLADHWSLDIPVYYSPFTVADDYRFRTFTMQPSVRYWFKPEMKGHFLGVHVTGAAFNFATDKQFRYQDTDGAWGAGIDYGYALRFSRHWGMEFNIGVGYLWTRYETYYNIENGASCGTETLNYLGITRLGISLIYKL